MTLEQVRKEIGMVIEGVDNIEVAYKLAKKHKIETPIIDTVYQMLYHNLEPQKAVKILMTREKKAE